MDRSDLYLYTWDNSKVIKQEMKMRRILEASEVFQQLSRWLGDNVAGIPGVGVVQATHTFITEEGQEMYDRPSW
jgi:hypothetical protein